jgi:hypothetical protein
MDNLNGQIKDLNLKIDYPPFPELPISKVLGSVENLRVKDDHVFKIERKMLDPVILINKENVLVVAAIAGNPNAQTAVKDPITLASMSLPALMPQRKYVVGTDGKVLATAKETLHEFTSKDPDNNSPAVLKQLHGQLDSTFNLAWNTHLDTLDRFEAVSSGVHLSYEALGRITDEFFDQTKFAIDYKVNIAEKFGPQKISLGEIEKPNCSHISFACNLRDCKAEMKDCGGSCGWNPVCHAKKAACKVWNGLRYGECQVSNGLRVTWCAGELAAKKALCYSTIAAIFLYDNLIKEVGRLDGNAKAKGMVTVAIDRSIPGGLSSVGFRGSVQTDIDGEVNLVFIPTSLAGLMVCTMPAIAAFKLDNIKLSNSSLALNTKITKRTDNGMPFLHVRLDKVTLPIQLQQPFIAQILGRSNLIMSCNLGILVGLSYLRLFEHDKFKQFIDLALKGTYKLEVEQDFSIKLPPLELGVLQYPLSLKPAWGGKSLMYTNLKN